MQYFNGKKHIIYNVFSWNPEFHQFLLCAVVAPGRKSIAQARGAKNKKIDKQKKPNSHSGGFAIGNDVPTVVSNLNWWLLVESSPAAMQWTQNRRFATKRTVVRMCISFCYKGHWIKCILRDCESWIKNRGQRLKFCQSTGNRPEHKNWNRFAKNQKLEMLQKT